MPPPAPPWIDSLNWLHLDLLTRLVLAAILGALIGAEREMSGKPAGLRTNLLICLGAALLTEMSIMMPLGMGARGDPTRIAAQIVSGVGFLGAGMILQGRGGVVGLTSAATMWVVAAIGMAVGARAYVEAIGTTVLVVCALILLRRVELLILRGRVVGRTIVLTMDPDPALLETVRVEIAAHGLELDQIEIEASDNELNATFTVSGQLRRWMRVTARLITMPGVRRLKES